MAKRTENLRIGELFLEAGSSFNTLADMTLELEDLSQKEETKKEEEEVPQKGAKKAGKRSGRGRGKAVSKAKLKSTDLEKKVSVVDMPPSPPTETGLVEKPSNITLNMLNASESVEDDVLYDLENITTDPFDYVDFLQ